jgi:uncharacterized membrane protein
MIVDTIRYSLQSGIGLSRLPVVFSIILLILFAFHDDSKANVRICNQTATTATVAIAYVELDDEGTSTNQHRGIMVEGWWNIEPNQCKVVSGIHAGNHWVYYYAHSGDRKWGGRSWLCVTSGRFETHTQFKRQNDPCPAGYRLQGFRAMTTDAKNHTLNLK